MSIRTYSPTCVVGDTIEFPIQWVDSENSPISFLHRRVDFVVRVDLDDEEVLYSINSLEHETLVDRLEVTRDDVTLKGELLITLPSSETQAFPIGTLPYQLQVTELNGTVKTILRGSLHMIADVAR